jgi:hypothetical protein
LEGELILDQSMPVQIRLGSQQHETRLAAWRREIKAGVVKIKALKTNRLHNMKTRKGFVSNSSSCSFVIIKKGLTDDQVKFIENFEKELAGKCYHLSSWSCDEGFHIPGSDYCDSNDDGEGEPSYIFSADRDRVECDISDMSSNFEDQGIKVENLGCDC